MKGRMDDVSLLEGTVTCVALSVADWRWLASTGNGESALTAFRALTEPMLQSPTACLFADTAPEPCVVFAFRRSTEALMRAHELVQESVRLNLPGGDCLRVSTGIATGEVIGDAPIDSAPVVQRALWLARLAQGDQILVGGSTEQVARESMPADYGFLDLGQAGEPEMLLLERVHQLTHPSLIATFPALPTEGLPRHNLPRTGFFIGRLDEVDELLETVHHHRRVAVTGAGGVGKTAFVREVAFRMLGDLPDGAWFVDVSSITAFEQLVESVIDVLGIRPLAGLTHLELLLRQIASKDLLLLLDGCERAANAVTRLMTELQPARGVRIIATSSRSLGNEGMYPVRLQGLSWPEEDDLPLTASSLEEYESTALFMDRAREAKAGFEVSDEDAGLVVKICQQVRGIPLAIVLAARRVRDMSLWEICDRIGSLDIFNDPGAPPRSRHRTLRRALDWSYTFLGPEAQYQLPYLGLMNCPWTVAHAIGISGLPEGEAASEAIRELVEANFVERAGIVQGEERYQVTETIRHYALSLLAGSDLEDAKEQHSRYFLDLLRETAPQLNGSRQAEVLDYLDSYRQDLRRALELAIRPGEHPSAFIEAMVRAWGYWYHRNRLTEAMGLIKKAIRACPRSYSRDIARMLNLAGVMARKLGETSASRTYLRRGLRYLEKGDHDDVRAAILCNLGHTEWDADRVIEADRAYRMSSELARKMGSGQLLSGALTSRAMTLAALGRPDEAEDGLREAERLLGGPLDAHSRWSISLNRGQACLVRGEWHRANEALSDALCAAGELGDPQTIAYAFYWLAELSYAEERWEQSAQFLGAMSAFRKRSGTINNRSLERRENDLYDRLASRLGTSIVRQLLFSGALKDLQDLAALNTA